MRGYRWERGGSFGWVHGSIPRTSRLTIARKASGAPGTVAALLPSRCCPTQLTSTRVSARAWLAVRDDGMHCGQAGRKASAQLAVELVVVAAKGRPPRIATRAWKRELRGNDPHPADEEGGKAVW